MVLSKVPKVGGELEARCAKCKDDTLHTIVALEGKDVALVQCQACSSKHKYHPARTEKKPAAKPAPAKVPKKSAEEVARSVALTEWRNVVEVAGDDLFKPYMTTGVFQEGDKVDHPTFGRGLVRSVPATGKMDVIFETGIRRLIFNLKNQ